MISGPVCSELLQTCMEMRRTMLYWLARCAATALYVDAC